MIINITKHGVFSAAEMGTPSENQVCLFCPCGCIWWLFTVSQTLGDSEGQRNLACCSPWSHRVGRDLAAEQLVDLSKYIRPFHLGYRRWAPLCHSKASGGADLSQGPCVGGHLPNVLKMLSHGQTGWCGLRTQWRQTQWCLLTIVF